MGRILLFLVLTMPLNFFGQNNDLQKVSIDTAYSWHNTTLAEWDQYYFALPQVQNTEYQIHIRIILSGQRIDFFSKDGISFKGELTQIIMEYEKEDRKQRYGSSMVGFVFYKQDIDSAQSTRLAKSILQSGQDTLPTDTLIPSWNLYYFDCNSISFQIFSDSNYVEQTYTCPWHQPQTAKYAGVVLDNFELLKDELDLVKKYEEFTKLLEKGNTYSRDGYFMIYVFTEEENIAWQKDKPRREYLKTVKDTITQYINYHLDSLHTHGDSLPLSCHGSYKVYFGRNGKLKTIRHFHSTGYTIRRDGLWWTIEDRFDRWRCKRKLKRIFRNMSLKSFNAGYELSRVVEYDSSRGWTVSDRTLY